MIVVPRDIRRREKTNDDDPHDAERRHKLQKDGWMALTWPKEMMMITSSPLPLPDNHENVVSCVKTDSQDREEPER